MPDRSARLLNPVTGGGGSRAPALQMFYPVIPRLPRNRAGLGAPGRRSLRLVRPFGV